MSVNLHFSNLPDQPRGDPWQLLESTYRGYAPFARYLKSALDRLERQTYRSRWESFGGPAPKAESMVPEGVWIRLLPTDPDANEEEFDAFLDESVEAISDDPKAGKGKIRVHLRERERGILLLERRPTKEVLYVHPRTYSLFRQLQALELLEGRPHPEHRPLTRLAERWNDSRWPPVAPAAEPKWKILTDGNFPGVEAERAFVRIALGTPDFAILEGPPGSGKTITICELIVQEVIRGNRVLLAASTHVAVDNVLEKLHALRLTKDLVMAIRIGAEENVSDVVVPYILANRIKHERALIQKKLAALQEKDQAQEYLLSALRADGESVISSLFIESANLVCGTTLGILQHPEVKGEGEFNAHPRFDVLIVDEASKTTFQEFLVPALLAKRWILVGDVRQLSPYVEEGEVAQNLAGLLDSDQRRGLLAAFLADERPPNRRGRPMLFLDESQNARQVAAAHADGLGIGCVAVPQADIGEASLALLSSDLFVMDPESLKNASSQVPADAEMALALDMPARWLRQREHWLANRERFDSAPDAVALMREDEAPWEEELAWRLIRQFELRRDPEAAADYTRVIGKLLPLWGTQDEQQDIRREVDLVRRMAFPSILELLQEGFERDRSNFQPTTLTHGLPPDAFSQRHVLLAHQHRMHPQISDFPRRRFYNDEALQDPDYLEAERSWTYARYRNRAVWSTVVDPADPSQRSNSAEANHILREVRRFVAWASANPRIKAGKKIAWDVAILTFYRRQQALLRRLLQAEFGSDQLHHFESKDGSARVVLGTVDRFQGHEADVVFLSFVRTWGVGFLDSPNRLNVALTRARYQIVLVGNRPRFASNKRSETLRLLATEIGDNIEFAVEPRSVS